MHGLHCATTASYPVIVSPGLLDPANRALADAIGPRRGLVVTVPDVDALHGRALRSYLTTVPGEVAVHVADLTERTKTMASVLELCDAAQRHGLGRRDVLVAFGGGVCSDVVSVAATLIRRGIPYVSVPTTLVGQVDAGIALKGGVNFGGSKNYLGCFTPPSSVLLDTSLLRTVPVAELRAGLAEIVKVALVLDADLLSLLRDAGPQLAASGFTAPAGVGSEVVVRAVRLMLDELAKNPYEQGPLQRLVDFGHTFSPRLEELSGYRLRHGEAVAIDMALSCVLGVELGVLADDDCRRVLGLLRSLSLPVHSPHCTPAQLMAAMRAATAHRDGHLNLVVPVGLGRAAFVRDIADLPTGALEGAVARLGSLAAGSIDLRSSDGVPVMPVLPLLSVGQRRPRR